MFHHSFPLFMHSLVPSCYHLVILFAHHRVSLFLCRHNFIFWLYSLGTDIEPPMTPLPEDGSGSISRSSMADKPTENKLPVGTSSLLVTLLGLHLVGFTYISRYTALFRLDPSGNDHFLISYSFFVLAFFFFFRMW